jgi:hypothetical protein
MAIIAVNLLIQQVKPPVASVVIGDFLFIITVAPAGGLFPNFLTTSIKPKNY